MVAALMTRQSASCRGYRPGRGDPELDKSCRGLLSRVVRGSVLVVRETGWVEAMRALGAECVRRVPGVVVTLRDILTRRSAV